MGKSGQARESAARSNYAQPRTVKPLGKRRGRLAAKQPVILPRTRRKAAVRRMLEPEIIDVISRHAKTAIDGPYEPAVDGRAQHFDDQIADLVHAAFGPGNEVVLGVFDV